jgi:hypothetical protein
MSNFEAGFALGSAKGPEFFLEGADLGDALDEAERVYPSRTPIVFEGDLFTAAEESQELSPNRARGAVNAAAKAHKRSGLGTYSAFDIVERISYREAHERLLPYFQSRWVGGAHKGKLVKAHDTAAKMRENFLTANAKLTKAEAGYKELGFPASLSVGPNLLPHAMLEELKTPRGRLPLVQSDSAQRKYFPRAAPFRLPRVPGGIDFCIGSNAACRATCLVYSGNNPVADGQTLVKMARSLSLVMDPEAWVRMFVAAIERHVEQAAKKDFVPYIRPNVLSDIPWELICPELFELFPDLGFYDYTKIPGRTGLPNYDLTFSFSGTNERQTVSELKRGHRVAVVFWLPNTCYKRGSPFWASP